MKTTFVSTLGLASSVRNNVPRVQAELTRASVEVSTSRHADVGLALGTRTSRVLSIRLEYASIGGYLDSNKLLQTQLQRTQMTIGAMREGANSFLSNLVSLSGNSPSDGALLVSQAKAGLASFIDLANTSGGGQYLFGGINSAVQPIADYSGAPKLALDTAFATAFGLTTPPQDDPAVANITPAAMQTFLDGAFANLFADPQWGTTWSSASNVNLSSRIADGERIETSRNANEPALRKLAMAYAMTAELGGDKLSTQTRNVLAAKARDLVGSAISDLGTMQTHIGVAEERVSTANKRLSAARDLASKDITALEGTDPIEAKVRFDTLSTQVEMSYALTTRLLNLSILKYA